MKSTIRQWGNSAAVRIPASVMRAVPLALDEDVEVREDGGRIVIEPVRRKTYDLGALLKDVTPKNLHSAIEFGEPAGNEVW